MAHYFDSGYVMHKPAWHGLAPVYDEYPESWDVARDRSGLTWDPMSEPIYARRLTDDELLSGITATLENVPAGERACLTAGAVQRLDAGVRGLPAHVPLR